MRPRRDGSCRRVVLVCGPPGSGKSAVAVPLAEGSARGDPDIEVLAASVLAASVLAASVLAASVLAAL